MLVTVTIPGATPFGLSSPPCDDEDDPTKIAQLKEKVKKCTTIKRNKNPIAKYSGLWHKTTFFEKKKKTELFKKDFRISTVPGWNFYSLGFIIMVIEMVR
jgi:hypothetical protein